MDTPGPPARRPSEHAHLWLIYLAAGGVAMIAYAFVPVGLPTAIIYELVGLSSVGAVLLGIHLHQPERRLPWQLMAAGLALWAIADGVGNWLSNVRGIDAFPTVADPIYLLGYAVVAVGIVALIGRHGRDSAGTLDSLILTTSLAVLSWVLLARPTIATYQDSPAAAAVAISYPIADIVLAGLLIRLVTTPGGRTRSYGLLVLALVLLIAADTASSALQLLTFADSQPLDYLWMASYLAWGAAALDRSMVSLSAPVELTRTRFSRGRLAALTIAVLIAPVTLGVETALGVSPTVWAVVIFSIIAFLLVLARMNLSIEQIQAANAERTAAQAELTHQAAHDPLTGLANRAQAMRLIAASLSRAQRSGAVIGLLFIDLDGFKQVNDTLGHQAGDEVLRAVADRMQRTVRAGDVVARLGGDEFLVLLEPLDEQPSGVSVAERIIAAIAEPLRLSTGHHARIGASGGLAISQDAGTDPERLLHEADIAVYRAKSGGRGRIEVFDRSLRDRLVRRSVIERSVMTALAGNSVDLTVEPVVELITGELGGMEARVRCRVGDALVDRSDLMAELGRSPAIIDLDSWAMQHGCATLAALSRGREALTIAVPVTAHHLLLDRVCGDVADALAASGLAANRLILLLSTGEITDDLRLLANLDTLRGWGVRVCLDGFGAGTAPTNQLLQLPVAMVRLHRTMVRQAIRATPNEAPGSASAESAPPTSPQMLRLTVQTAHAFGYRVIASGLDDRDALAAATHAGCAFGQGLAATDLLPDHATEPSPLARRP
ncbi:MAG TPA: diguanylate cyclase [Microlunatus sp.]